MAKLSEQKKVELLEETVLTGTAEDVASVMEEQGPFEFTARALGYAARYRGCDMVKCLIDRGATFAYEPGPAFVRKYSTKVTISNFYSYNVDFSLYLLKDQKINPVPDNVQVLDDEERGRVLELLHTESERVSFNESDVLYYTILYYDTSLRDACAKLGINALSDERASIIRCDTNYAHMDGLNRHFRDEFTWTLRRAEQVKFKYIMTNILPLINEKTMQLMPADLFYDFTDKKEFFSVYCAEGLFEQMVKGTNLLDKVKKWDIIYALIDCNNSAGLSYVLEEQWITKPKEISTLQEYVLSKVNLSPELVALAIQFVEQNAPKKASSKAKLSLDADPLSPAALKKEWTFKDKSDGTLIVTSYKGASSEVIIPQEFNGKQVTEIGEHAFSPYKSRITRPQAEQREKIVGVQIPEGIVSINEGAFYGCKALSLVNIPSTVMKIEDKAFCGCDNLHEVTIPESVERIGHRAFSADDYLGHAKHLTIRGKACSAAAEFATTYGATFMEND